MKKMRLAPPGRAILIASFIAILFYLRPAHGLERSEITFYAGFEGTLAAEKARGKKEPVKADKFRFAEGIIGKGVVTEGRITFDYRKNVNPGEATVSVWAKPINWGSSDIKTGQLTFFRIYGNPNLQIATVYWGVTRFWMYKRNKAGGYDGTNIGRFGAFWEPGRWRHLVITWRSEKESQFFIDGVQMGRVADDVMAVKAGSDFSIGTKNMVFDELMIFKRALRAEEVRALFYGVMRK